jgi:tRNA dimethylallyltransferase
MDNSQKVIVVVGPTASGKSNFAVELALSKKNNLPPYIDGEIISADSRQVYKKLDIGTGKITKSEMKGVPHHMLDVYELGEQVGVARYRDDTLPTLEAILARGKTPIICGGTGQYIDALIDTVSIPNVQPDHTLRKLLEAKSTDELFEELLSKDTRRAQAIDKHNRVRLIRALEIVASLGTVPVTVPSVRRYPTVIYLMEPSRELLKERITRRLLKRLNNGMIEEVQQLLDDGMRHEELFRLGLEYRYLSLFIQKKITRDEMITQLTAKIWQYAKRQLTWNKKYLPEATVAEVKE